MAITWNGQEVEWSEAVSRLSNFMYEQIEERKESSKMANLPYYATKEGVERSASSYPFAGYNGWHGISSAPKDGSWFLAYRPKANIGNWDRFVICRWHDEFDDFVWAEEPFDIFERDIDEKNCYDQRMYNPYESKGSFTHWMPLPPKPNEGR